MTAKKKYIIAMVSLLIAAVAGWLITGYYYMSTNERTPRIPLIELKDSQKAILPENTLGKEANSVTVKIFLPSEEGMTVEDRKILSSSLPVIFAESLVNEYLKGLQGGLEETKLIAVYQDRANIFYVDLSDDFRRNFSGDVRQEYYLLKSLYSTVIGNIMGAEDVKILIEGKEIESIGGHFYSLYPLKATVTKDVISEQK
ncbi:MAG: GerMN domain-containing protein [Dissulfurispiraceae bacterium]